MEFFDALVFLGRRRGGPDYQAADLDGLRRMLDRYGIARAVVHSVAATLLEVAYGNERVFDAAEQEPRLVPCPAVVPDDAENAGGPEAYVDGLLARGARCVAVHENAHQVSLAPEVMGGLLAALEARRVPTAVMDNADALRVGQALRAYPGLPVLLHAPRYRTRNVVPALRAYPNLYVSVVPGFCPYRGLETLRERIGVDRVLYGSGFPLHEPGAPMSQVLLSALTDAEAAQVAGGNLSRLVEGVRVSKSARSKRAISSAPWSPARGLGAFAGPVLRREPPDVDGITDMHAHYGRWYAYPMYGGEADDLVAEMDRAGVARMVVAHEACMGPESRYGNDVVLDAARRYPGRILGYACCSAASEETGVDEVRRALDAGLVGVKLHTGAGHPYTHERYRPVWALADARGLPVLLHTWADLDKYEHLFEAYPRAQILLGHAGVKDPDQYVACARRHANVWLDITYSAAPYGVVETFVREVGAQRVLFGSDAPWMSVQQQLGRVLFADVSDADKRTILVDNPTRVLEGGPDRV